MRNRQTIYFPNGLFLLLNMTIYYIIILINVYKMPLLYHIMNKLESDGFIEKSRREISENNRVRVYYRITERGIHYLNEITGAYSRLSQSVSSILFGEESNP